MPLSHENVPSPLGSFTTYWFAESGKGLPLMENDTGGKLFRLEQSAVTLILGSHASHTSGGQVMMEVPVSTTPQNCSPCGCPSIVKLETSTCLRLRDKAGGWKRRGNARAELYKKPTIQ